MIVVGMHSSSTENVIVDAPPPPAGDGKFVGVTVVGTNRGWG